MTLEELSKELDVAVEELEKIKKQIELKYTGLPIPPTELDKYIELGIKQHFQKDAGMKTFYGITLILNQPRDGVRKRREEILKEYLKDREATISKGSVMEISNGVCYRLDPKTRNVMTIPVPNEKILQTGIYLPDNDVRLVFLDAREKWDNGKKNFNFMKPLPLEQWFTTVQGICTLDGNEQFYFTMTFNCEEHIKDFPIGKLVKFDAKIRKHEGNFMELGYNAKKTKFEKIEGDITSLYEKIDKFYDSISLSGVDKTYRRNKDDNKPFNIVSVAGLVKNAWIGEPTVDKPNPWGTIMISDITREEPFKLVCHPSLKIDDINEGSYIKAWGTLSEGNKWDAENNTQLEEKEISMFASGIFQFNIQNDNGPEDSDGWD